MHRRISTTLNTLRQDLAAKLGCDFIHHACRQAGHSRGNRFKFFFLQMIVGLGSLFLPGG